MREKKTVKKMSLAACAIAILLTGMSCLGVNASTYIWNTETKIKLGDARQDQVVDSRDLVRVKRHVADETVEIVQQASDMDFDGDVDGDDISLLRYQLIGCDQYWSGTY